MIVPRLNILEDNTIRTHEQLFRHLGLDMSDYYKVSKSMFFAAKDIGVSSNDLVVRNERVLKGGTRFDVFQGLSMKGFSEISYITFKLEYSHYHIRFSFDELIELINDGRVARI
jgi:hypothetical protein